MRLGDRFGGDFGPQPSRNLEELVQQQQALLEEALFGMAQLADAAHRQHKLIEKLQGSLHAVEANLELAYEANEVLEARLSVLAHRVARR